MKLFLSKGANVNAPNTSGGEVKFGKIQLIKLTPLMMASTFCAPDVVKTLLDAGAKVNDADIRGMTPIQFAVSSEAQNPAVVKLLLKAGADVNAKSSVGETALDWAKKFGSKEVIAALTSAGARRGSALHRAAAQAGGRSEGEPGSGKRRRDIAAGSSEFFKQSGCVGCHHQPVAAVAAAAARTAGVHVDESAAKGFVKMMEGEMMFFNQMLLERLDTGGSSDGPTWKLMALASERYPSSLLTDTLVGYLAHFQRHDGSWWFGGISRAPFEEGCDGADRDGDPRHAGLRHAGHEGGSRPPDRARPQPIWQTQRQLPTMRRRCRFWDCLGGRQCCQAECAGEGVDRRAACRRRLGPESQSGERCLRDRRVAIRAERGGRSGGVRRGLSKGREVSDGHAMRGRLLVCAQPRA